VISLPGVFIGEEFLKNGVSVVEAAAHGRKAAIAIHQFLNLQAG
jgi:NADPH-dependent glutamate synthase beta subunit-like oxidoreductase